MPWLVGVVLGLAVGLLAGLAVPALRRPLRRPSFRLAPQTRRPPAAEVRPVGPAEDLPLTILANAPIGIVLLNRSDEVVLDNEASRRMGIAVAGKAPPAALLELARTARRQGGDAALQEERTLPSFGWRSQPLEVRVRAIALRDGMITLLVEDGH